jgi:hypothetical protein
MRPRHESRRLFRQIQQRTVPLARRTPVAVLVARVSDAESKPPYTEISACTLCGQAVWVSPAALEVHVQLGPRSMLLCNRCLLEHPKKWNQL